MAEKVLKLDAENIAKYKKLLFYPREFGIDSEPFDSLIEECKKPTPLRVLYEDYCEAVDHRLIPPAMFNLIMKKKYGLPIGNSRHYPEGGFKIKIKQ